MRTPGTWSAGRSPVARTLALLVCVALSATACGASRTGSAGPTAAVTPSSPGPTGTRSGTPSPSATGPTYRPATGPRVSLKALTLRAPHGWKLDSSYSTEIVSADDPHFVDELTFSDTSIYPGTSLSRAERIVSRDDEWKGTPKSLPRVALDGEPFFHLAGPAPLGRWYEAYGHVVDGRLVELAFKSRESRDTRARIFGSVLATLHLR